jgi:hypothetical protein
VAHGGRNSKRRGPQRQMYISPKFWFDQLFFKNHDKLNINKIRGDEGGCGAASWAARI